jgi:hypothetical protein
MTLQKLSNLINVIALMAGSKNKGIFAKRGVLIDVFYVQINTLLARINNWNIILQKLSNLINAMALLAGSKKKGIFAKRGVLIDVLRRVYMTLNIFSTDFEHFLRAFLWSGDKVQGCGG